MTLPAFPQVTRSTQQECHTDLAIAVLKLQKRFYEIEEREQNRSNLKSLMDAIAGRSPQGESVQDINDEIERSLKGREGCTQIDVKQIFETSIYVDEITSNPKGTWVLMQCCGFEVDFAWDAKSGKIETFHAGADKNSENNMK